MANNEMRILGESIYLANGDEDIYKLKFLKDNPRVYACMHSEPDFAQLIEEEKQDLIYKKLLEEPSVRKLVPEIVRHGGLIEPILIRRDTMEVIEGNSRLAVYRKLHQQGEPGDWERIQCNVVTGLTDDQQAAFLNQIHVKGKTQWSAYEKANFAYVRKDQGWSVDKVAELFGESSVTIRTRVKVVEMMKHNEDNDRSHFSYYDVLVRNTSVLKEMEKSDKLTEVLFGKIKNMESEVEEHKFTAQDLRKKLPVILKKPKVLKKFSDGKIELDEGFQLAKISKVEENVRQAWVLLDDVSRKEVSQLDQSNFNAFRQAVRRLSQQMRRINKMIEVFGTK